MNCVDLFLAQARRNPKKMALHVVGQKHGVSFEELLALAQGAQGQALRLGIKKGDTVLLLDQLGPRLYGAIIGLLGLGVGVILVEPWMKVERIHRVIDLVKPKIFFTNWFGRLWGARVGAIRQIPHWLSVSSIEGSGRSQDFKVESVEENARGIITFTSGTTGDPKGVVRNQGYLIHQHRILSKALGLNDYEGPDLCIFANFALANLASGRGSVIMGSRWSARRFNQLLELCEIYRPQTMTCGPAFLLEFLKRPRVPDSLKSIHVGGALTDCWIFEQAFGKWPQAHFTHVYGSSEAEPVAFADAKAAVQESLKRGYFQTLYLGHPIDDIQYELQKDGLWVTGPHVCPEYLANEAENKANKKKDEKGRVWHFMGDRVRSDSEGWWYSGRSQQPLEDFELEQKIYSQVQSSKSFIWKDPTGQKVLVGEDLPESQGGFEKARRAKIVRDPRHRARIDRPKTLKEGGLI